MKAHLIVLLSVVAIPIAAQVEMSHQFMGASAQSHQSSAMQVSATVGQAVVGLVNGERFSLTQGFQQNDLLASTSYRRWLPIPGLSIYPNPFVNAITIDYHDRIEALTFEIHSLTGKKMSMGQVRSPLLSLGSLPTGSYILTLTKGNTNRQNLLLHKIQ